MNMTFGEKLLQLRKAKGWSQEDLAGKLNTSRQAVSKWENNNGYPETEKIIMISKLFHVDLNVLLMDTQELGESEARVIPEDARGFYVSRETANGFLLYYKRKFLLLASACGLVLGCNAVSYTSTEHLFFSMRVAPVLTTVSVMTALLVVIYICLKQNPYRMLRKKELIFAEDVLSELTDEFRKMKKILIAGIASGLIVFGVIGTGAGMQSLEEMAYTDVLADIVISMIMTGISSFVAFFCIGIYWSYSILFHNSERKAG